MPQELSRTPLYDRHVAQGAAMMDFAGWHMPLWYPHGAVAEHRICITNAGLFDTSHMSVVAVSARGALDLLQLCFTKDLEACSDNGKTALPPGNAVFGAFLNDAGELIDDAVLYRTEPQSFLVTVNAGMGGTVARHLKDHAADSDVAVVDLTGRVGKMDLQGPFSAKVLAKIVKNPEVVMRDMGYFTFKGDFRGNSPVADTFLLDGTPALVSRTGYTGEFGFEIFVAADRLVGVWEMILQAGEGTGLLTCGLAARDSLRAGAVLPLARQDIGPWPFINTPWDFVLPFDGGGTAFTKRFIGEKVLSLRESADRTYPYVGFDPRKVSIHDPAVVIGPSGERIGTVSTCVADMAMGRVGDRFYSMASPDKPADFKPNGLICGFVRVRTRLHPGEIVVLKDKRREIKAVITQDIRPHRSARLAVEEML